LLTTC